MKSTITLFILMIYSLISFGQKHHFTDTGNVWNTAIWREGPLGYQQYAGEYKIIGDTLISGKSYKIFVGGEGSSGLMTFIREDTLAGKVYINLNDTDRILYNYNLHAGDIVRFATFNSTSGPGYTYTDSVTHVDSIIIDGVYHKVFWLAVISGSLYYNSADAFIEGIGSVQDPYYPAFPKDGFESSEDLLCFSVSGIRPIMKTAVKTWKGGIDTFANTCHLGVSNIEIEHAITITPNPASDVITIQTTLKDAKAIIYNLAGRQLFSASLNPGRTVVPVSELQPGIYFCKLSSDNNFIIKKIVVLR